jgi:hypothetical protein
MANNDMDKIVDELDEQFEKWKAGQKGPGAKLPPPGFNTPLPKALEGPLVPPPGRPHVPQLGRWKPMFFEGTANMNVESVPIAEAREKYGLDIRDDGTFRDTLNKRCRLCGAKMHVEYESKDTIMFACDTLGCRNNPATWNQPVPDMHSIMEKQVEAAAPAIKGRPYHPKKAVERHGINILKTIAVLAMMLTAVGAASYALITFLIILFSR